jgi:hypothetical protein
MYRMFTLVAAAFATLAVGPRGPTAREGEGMNLWPTRRRVSAFAGLAAVIAAAVFVAPAGAAPFVNPANGHSYYLLDATSSWAGAEAAAVALGGHLATDNDPAEDAWIRSTFFSQTDQVWIGLNDQASENNWVWVSGEATPAWGPALTPVPGSGVYPWRASGEPNGGTGENCVYLGLNPLPFGGWVDYPCEGGDALVGLAEVPPPPPTTTDPCKNGGWQNFSIFKNQGDCVSFVATGGNNGPSGP